MKLRAYSHSERRYVPVRNVICNASGEPVSISSGGTFAKRYPIKDITLERWTGRKDRAGNLVFEGDIIQRFINPAGDYMYPGAQAVVEWKETATYTGWGITKLTERRIEVIGNRHEGVVVCEL